MGHITAITDLDKAIGKCMAFMCESLITLAANEPFIRTADSKTVYLDVRRNDEIEEKRLEEKPFLHAVCTLEDCTELIEKIELAQNMLYVVPGTDDFSALRDKSTPVIVFCRSGRRAGKAKEQLEGMGYLNVINGGSIEDVQKALANATKK